MRADLLLVKLGYARSRESAKKLIEQGFVFIDQKKISKPATDILYPSQSGDEPNITITEVPKYVSRGGYKLEGILELGKIDVSGAVCIDIGSSTGGFTDCLLQNGASHVYCVDSGKDQLDPSIANDERTTVLEKTNARTLSDDIIKDKADMIVMDVSFISQTLLHERVAHFLKSNGIFVSLIKPQFELTRQEIKKGGIVKSKKDRHTAISKVMYSCIENGLYPCLLSESSIKGGDGNTEYTAIFVKDRNDGYDWIHAAEDLP